MENKRELMQRALANQEVDRVPVGFWHHFVLGKDQFRGLEDNSILERVVQGHLDYFNLVQPDMMKIMSEGFFGYPPVMDNPLRTAEDLLKVRAIGEDHPWIQEQVRHVKRISELFKDKVMTFYNIFAPLQIMRIKFDFFDQDYNHFSEIADRFPEELSQAGLEIQKDFTALVRLLLKDGIIDGIYYPVQNIQGEKYDFETYQRLITPTELPLLEEANQLSDNNILHICGYSHYRNNLNFYLNYPAKVYNWAVHATGISVAEGRKIFPGKCILGGFDNNPNTLIDTGTKEQLYEYTHHLIQENRYKGYIIGADCSVPNDIDDHQLRMIREAAHLYRKN